MSETERMARDRRDEIVRMRPGFFDEEDLTDLADDPGEASADAVLQARRDYVQTAIAVAADEARNVVLTAGVAVAVVLFLLKDSLRSIQHLDGFYRAVCALAVFLLLLGAGLLLAYAAEINKRRMVMARCIASSDALRARVIWADRRDRGITKERGWMLRSGMVVIGVGMIGSALVVAALLLR